MLLAVLVLSLFGNINTSNATLIGDTVVLEHYYNGTYLTAYGTNNVVVTEGASDLVSMYKVYTVDMEADAILVDFTYTGSWASGTSNGLHITSFDWAGSDITGFTVDTNFAGWDDSRLTYNGSDTLVFNWQGLAMTTDTYFNAGINSVSVPEASSLALLSLGLILLGFRKLKRR